MEYTAIQMEHIRTVVGQVLHSPVLSVVISDDLVAECADAVVSQLSQPMVVDVVLPVGVRIQYDPLQVTEVDAINSVACAMDYAVRDGIAEAEQDDDVETLKVYAYTTDIAADYAQVVRMVENYGKDIDR